MEKTKHPIRLWAVLVWLLVWQGAGMLLARLWPHGHLLLATLTTELHKF